MVLLFLMVYSLGTVFGQTTPGKDSMLVLHVHQLGGYLSLSSAQEQALLVVERQQQRFQDSLSHLSLTVDQRRSVLTDDLNRHNQQLKSLFNTDQWKKYSDMQATRRAAFLKHASDKKVSVRELPVQER